MREAYNAPGGDPDWLSAWRQLHHIHVEKADGYGNDADKLDNYVKTSEAVHQPDEFTPMVRIHEKLIRCINLVDAGRANELEEEWLDIAALALGAEALRRRRTARV